jgi:hypothetical protein
MQQWRSLCVATARHDAIAALTTRLRRDACRERIVARLASPPVRVRARIQQPAHGTARTTVGGISPRIIGDSSLTDFANDARHGA